MNMNINVRGIRNGSKKLTRGVFQMGFYRPGNPGVKTGFDLQYFDIEYPEVVDPNNQNRRIFGSNYLELLDTKRIDKDVVTRFRFKNGSNETAKISLQNLSVYDDSGNKYVQREFSVFDGIQKRPHNYSTNHDVASNVEIEIEILFPNVATNAQNLRRQTLNLSGYTFEWNNINIKGTAGEKSTVMETPKETKINRTNYIVYNDFETKVRNRENVVGKKIILEKIYFATGSDEILTNSHIQLNRLAQLMQTNSNLKVEISGHTDNVGDNIQNMVLSQKRADAIKYYLMGKSISTSKIASVGKGATLPIANNVSDSGRQQNRRVEIKIVK
jgi:outer membrane protein OmpA-like peptidoglycan-associated protein